MKKKKDDENEKGIVESFLGGMPVFGDFFKELAKTETFKKRFKEVDEKIEENLRKGHKKKWGFEAHISVRPILNEVKEETSEISIGEDYFYGKKGHKLTLAVKVPKEDVDLKIKGKSLLITSDDFEKKIVLPDYFKSITRKQCEKGILVLELTK